jgi:hypothetical protein
VPLVARHAQLRRALLELDRVGPGEDRPVDELAGQVERAVVVDADLGDDLDWLPFADVAAADVHG